MFSVCFKASRCSTWGLPPITGKKKNFIYFYHNLTEYRYTCMYLNDHACFAKKMNATLKTNVSLYWRFETLKILNAAIFNKYFTCKIYIDVLKERFTHEKIVHCLGTGDKIHCNKAEVKPFCCSDGKGGGGVTSNFSCY